MVMLPDAVAPFQLNPTTNRKRIMLKPHIPVDLPKAKTILDDAGPLTEEETRNLIMGQAERIEKWAIEKLDVLLEYGDQYPAIAKYVCEKVTDKYGEDDQLSALLIDRLNIARIGKPKGKHTTWNYTRYYVLLTHYYLLRQFDIPRQEVLEKLADMEKLNGENRAKKIEGKITEARKQVNEADLPDFCHPPISRKKGE
jgi:hypothetical protein